ncbi:PREDICTED: uncharacterized protein LOC102175041 isoform X2 [Capra hircus]|uniref:uncharacterized protein LOC102175041 isoform X2 n=1 Tax=Capra hircus TaxID=9925 RepID=UPI00084737DA|nr:PREDICTED: uncharacterized protein LOC102175041 isoform X2 [Capra hircus]
MGQVVGVLAAAPWQAGRPSSDPQSPRLRGHPSQVSVLELLKKKRPLCLRPPTRLTPQTLRPEPALPGAAHPGQRPLPSLSLLAAVVPCPVTTATPLDAALTGSVCQESAPSALGDLLRPRAMAMTRPCPAAHGFPDLKPSLAWSCPDRQIGL